MRPLMYLRNRFRYYRRKWAARRRRNFPLREFVYLDEVSVYSLIASRVGPLAAEFTDKETTSLSHERSGDIEVDAKIAKLKGSEKRAVGYVQETQVLRKATIQATFRELYEYERGSFQLKLMEGNYRPPSVRIADDLSRAVNDSSFQGWIIDPRRLERGGLIELKLSLQADPAYTLSTNIATIADIVNDGAGMIPGFGTTAMDQILATNRILERLMVGLVPLLSRSTEYEIVELDGRELLVHRYLTSQLGGSPGVIVRPFYIAGVTESNLYWKDVRRILFSQAEFNALCRIDNPTVREKWTSVKLVELMRGTMPDVAREIETLGPQVLQLMSANNAGSLISTIAQQTQQRRLEALIQYGRILMQTAAVAITPQDEQQFSAIAAANAVQMGTRTADDRLRMTQ